MATENPKHIISDDDLIFVLTADEKKFNSRKEEFKERGIEKVPSKDIGKYISFLLSNKFSNYSWPETSFIILNNVEVQPYPLDDNININVPIENGNFNIIFLNSKVSKICISYSIKKEKNFNSIWLYKSIIDEIAISNFNLSDFQIQSCTFPSIRIYNHSKVKNLVGKDIQGNHHIDIKNSYLHYVRLANNGRIGVSFREARISNFTIQDSNIKLVYVSQSSLGDIRISDCKADNIIIDDLCFIKSMKIHVSEIKSINSNDSNSIGELWIFSSTIKKIKYFVPQGNNDLHIIESAVDDINISSAQINRLSFQKSSFQDVLFKDCNLICSQFYVAKCNNVNFENSKFCELTISSNLSKDSLLTFLKSDFYFLTISNFSSVLGFTFFRELKPISLNQLKQYNTYLKASFSYDLYQELLYKEKEDEFRLICNQNSIIDKNNLLNDLLTKYQNPTLILNQSSLGKAEFTDCDLSSFDFQFSNSKITEIFISGGTIPSDNIEVFNIPKKTLEWHEQKVSVYNQLKKVFDSQGDIFLSSHFQSKTSKHQSKVLELRLEKENKTFKSRNEKVSKFFSTNRFDSWAFKLNEFSNLHGENWGRALAFTLFIPIPFYLFYLCSVGRLFLFDKEIDLNLIGYYFSFLDPTHKIDFLTKSEKDINGWARFCDFVSRIVVSYGIYQLIVAFRKLGKKN
jgi:uncharacterized protein YjbI with pentapeptide repeats